MKLSQVKFGPFPAWARTFVMTLLGAIIAMDAAAATIYRCDRNGVPTFQDKPCEETGRKVPASDQIRQAQIDALEEQLRDLVRRQRFLTLEVQRAREEAIAERRKNNGAVFYDEIDKAIEARYAPEFDLLQSAIDKTEREIARLRQR